MYVFLVSNHTEYESDMAEALFSTEALAREFARTAELFTDSRSIVRFEVDNPEPYNYKRIAFHNRDEKDQF